VKQKYVILKVPSMTHETYIAAQQAYQMSLQEREDVDTIVTSLMNLGLQADAARKLALSNYREAIRAKMARAEKNLGVIA
jgi:hypothetical protein